MKFIDSELTVDDMEKFEGVSLEAIGHRLRVTRLVLGKSQIEFCRGAGIATNTYNQYEKGKTRPTVENAILLCTAYRLTLDWIYRGDPSGLSYALADAVREARQAECE